MANNAYICRVRTDIPAGVLQVTDLHPNTSQASAVYQPVTQSGYVPSRVENDGVNASVAANVTTKALSGLAAYLVDTIENGAGNGLSGSQADAAAASIIALVDAGSAATGTVIDGLLNAQSAGAGLSVSGVSSLADVLKILGGGKYSVPAGTAVNSGAAYKGSADGEFDDSSYRAMYVTGSLQLSCGEGVLSKLASTSFSYKGTAGRSVTVYDSEGNVLA